MRTDVQMTIAMDAIRTDLIAANQFAEAIEAQLNADNQDHRVCVELEKLIVTLVELRDRLLHAACRLAKSQFGEAATPTEQRWSNCMQLLEHLATRADSLVARAEAMSGSSAIASKPELKYIRAHIQAVNTLPLEQLRIARRDRKLGWLTPLSVVKAMFEFE